MRKVVPVAGYIVFSLFVCVLPVEMVNTFTDELNVLFLNNKALPNYRLLFPNMIRIILFCLFINLLLYLLYSDVNEYLSFMQMKMYRTNKKDTFFACVKRDLINCFILFITLLTVVLLASLLMVQVNIDGVSIAQLGLYLFRMMSIFFILIVVYDTGSLLGVYTNISYICTFTAMACLIVDTVFQISVITFSGQINFELWAAMTMLFLDVFACIVCWKIFKNRGDVL